MKKNDLTKSVFAALLLVSTVAVAEDKYPASDFQPKVVYQDDSATSGASSAPAAPAAASSSSSSSGDSQYPAANFEPKVVYSDADYKHTESSPGASSSSSAESGASSSASAPAAAAKDDYSAGYFLGLIGLGIAGYILFKRGAGMGSAPKTSSVAKAAGGLTGVARYVLKTSGTGVTRYLEKHAKTAPSAGAVTGVARYLASHGGSANPAGKAATGVEKYMRNKG